MTPPKPVKLSKVKFVKQLGGVVFLKAYWVKFVVEIKNNIVLWKYRNLFVILGSLYGTWPQTKSITETSVNRIYYGSI